MFHKPNPFYVSKEWRRLRREVLGGDKYECQICKAKGKYTRANHVHHVMHLDEHPELGLEEFYIDESGVEQRQLVSLCNECHMIEHNYQHKQKQQLNEERW